MDENINGNSDQSWNSWRKHILLELKRHNTILEDIIKQNNRFAIDINRLNVYSSIFGFIGGVIATLLITKVI